MQKQEAPIDKWKPSDKKGIQNNQLVVFRHAKGFDGGPETEKEPVKPIEESQAG